jgi:enoyl-[acyl-carrier-protein] reductase (NADH)
MLLSPHCVPTSSLLALNPRRPVWQVHRDKEGKSDITPEDIANSILYLASDLSTKVSGAILPVDQAWSTI